MRRRGAEGPAGLRALAQPSLAAVAVLRFLGRVDRGQDPDAGMLRRFGVDWTPGEQDRDDAREILAEAKTSDFAAVAARRVLNSLGPGPEDAA